MASEQPDFGTVLARYESEEMPKRHSTRTAYLSYLRNHVRPRWADTPLLAIKPIAVEEWLNHLDLANKSKAHVRNLMHVVFNCALRWELVDRNPITLVRVRGSATRARRPRILTIEQFHAVLAELDEPYRTMVLVAGCLGLRSSEIMGLQWGDFDFDASTLLVQRSVVHGRVDAVKTEYSQDEVPLDPRLGEVLLRLRERGYPTREGWVFANPRTGKPYHQDTLQQKQLRAAGVVIHLGFSLGWHTFRHSYRSWLDFKGAPMSVQKELMRHASIQTTMNIYGRAVTETKRLANSRVVAMILEPPVATEHTAAAPIAANGS